ncbi:MAG: pyrroline-5-carboxylate reductase, partial [Clostridia bacterium]|nr:pyrroline-5-carboxylate reductase [Clostridia bacterium]
EELIDRVCSKGGTTIEAINVFDARGVEDAVVEGMEACTKRACELDLK